MKKREKLVGKDRKSDKPAPPPVSSLEQASSPSASLRTTKKKQDETTLLSARRSTRVAVDKYTHDGDSWQETLAVCEMPANCKTGEIRMKIRSYYSNQRTGDRVWDEPPSGASRVLPATEEMRKMAELQLNEMQITFGSTTVDPQATSTEKQRRSSRSFLKRHKSSPATNTTTSSTTTENTSTTPKFKVKYKPGSILSGIKKKPPKAAAVARRHDDSLDPEVQKAIALSMNESNASATSIHTSSQQQEQQEEDEPVIRSEVVFRDDELEMVMAMSLSEAEFAQTKSNNKLSEEEMFQRALEESRRSTSTSKVAALPVKDEFSGLLGLSQSSSSDDARRRRRSSDDDKVVSSNATDASMDVKMPAKPTKTSSTSRVNTDSSIAVGDTNRQSSRRTSAGDAGNDRKEAALSRDSYSRSSRSTASGASRNHSSSQGVSSNSAKSGMKERLPSQDSSDSKPSTTSSSSSARYGKSLRPPSNKNLSITGNSSGSSRGSFNAAREQAAVKKVVKEDSQSNKFSPFTDSVELAPSKGISVKEFAKTRSQRSLFATRSKTKGSTR